MSRNIAIIVVIGYFIVAVIAPISFQFMLTPLARTFPVPYMAGEATGLFIGSAIIPLGWWAYRRFEPKRAMGPLLTWGIILLGAIITDGNNKYQADQKQIGSAAASIAGTSNAVHNEFVRGALTTCIKRSTAANGDSRFTAQQINIYCQCYAEQMAREITPDDLKYYSETHQVTAAFRERINSIAPTCNRLMLEQ